MIIIIIFYINLVDGLKLSVIIFELRSLSHKCLFNSSSGNNLRHEQNVRYVSLLDTVLQGVATVRYHYASWIAISLTPVKTISDTCNAASFQGAPSRRRGVGIV